MATGVTAGVKRSRGDMPVYASHLSAKRCRSTKPLPCDVNALLRSDGRLGDDYKVEQRARCLDALNISGECITALANLVGNATLALVDLNANSTSVKSTLREFSVVDLNIRSHAYCMGSKNEVGNAFLAATNINNSMQLAREVFKFTLDVLFAQENSVSVQVLSGGGVRDVLLADWCRQYKFCTHHENTPNVVIISAEGGRTFLIPFAT